MCRNSKTIIGLLISFSIIASSNAQDNTPHMPNNYAGPVNYIRVWDVQVPINVASSVTTKSLREVKMTTQYFDGIGRPVETVTKQGSLITTGNPVDMVNAQTYDEFGRETWKYLPFASNGNNSINNGSFKEDPWNQQVNFYSDVNLASPIKGQGETYYYGKTEYESSPLNRVERIYAPGNSWVSGTGNGAKLKYWLNTNDDAVRIWNVVDVNNSFGNYSVSTYNNGIYPAGSLYKNVTEDEKGKQVIEFNDKDGKVILKKTQLSDAVYDNGTTGKGHSGWLCTYYVYDDSKELRCVIQPKAIEAMDNANNWTLDPTMLSELCFRYEYDSRGNLIMKKVPGAEVVYYIYDARDRLVMTQDANLRNAQPYQKFLFTQYDDLNRPIRTGTISTTGDWVVHRDYAANSTNYPWVEGYTNEIFTETHYNDYVGLPSGLINTLYNSGYGAYLNSSSSSPDFAEPIIQTNALKGVVTWTKVKVLGSSPAQYIQSCNIYDDKLRVIQTQSINITGGFDVVTNQYSFSSQLLRSHAKHQKAGTNPQTFDVATINNYDDLGRVTSIEKNLNDNLGWKKISSLSFDALGQLRTKKLAPSINGGSGLETINYDYNIRGWVLGMNRDFSMTPGDMTHFFGFDLAYDKTAIFRSNGSAVLPGYNNAAYNGNITGTIWKSRGDDVLRKYDFSYDNVNRLTGANYIQYSNNSWNNSDMNFEVTNISYDVNGNLKSMWQKGWKGTMNDYVDKLTYNYQVNGSGNDLRNKLQAVYDGVVGNNTLRDFTDNNPYPNDYTYDDNGNLKWDYNKGISSINYNYLNLPEQVTVAAKGTIQYTYDAAGNKLKKLTTDYTSGGTIVTTTTYIGGFIYESKQASQPSDYIDKLQYISTEEGRIRLRTTDNTFQYDYFIKDHLGNVRMVLTEEQRTNYYPATTFEGSSATGALSMVNYEKQFYTIDNSKITSTAYIPGWTSSLNYQNNNGNPPPNSIASGSYPSNYTVDDGGTSSNMYKVHAYTNKTALAVVVKVMAGDVMNIFGKSYFYSPGQTFSNSNSSTLAIADIFNALLGSSGNPASQKGLTENNLETLNSGNYALPSNLIRGYDGSSSSSPKAYINYIIFDDQLHYVTSGFSRVGNSGSVKNHWNDPSLQNISVSKNGYLYVYVSNESYQDVFFDNLQVVHTRGPILEETHYYPFGLTMQGISSEAVAFGQPENKKKFTGQEIDDDLGLDWYQFAFRSMDPQIGRFLQVDPLSNKYPYSSNYAYAENRVINSIDVEGLEAKLAIAGNSTDMVNYDKDAINAFNDRANRLQKIAGYTAKQVNTGDQIINLMVEATKNEGSISSIVFYTHGTPQGVILDENQGLYSQNWNFGNANSANVFDIKAKVKNGEIKFAENALIIFASCNAEGEMRDGLLSIAESFHEQLGVTVIASTGKVEPEEVNGKETGTSVSRGTFVKIETATTTVISIPGDDGSARSEKKVVIGTDRTDLGKKIDPAKISN